MITTTTTTTTTTPSTESSYPKRRKINIIPKEIFQNIIKYMDWTDILPILSSLDQQQIKNWWFGRTMKILNRKDLQLALRTPKIFIGDHVDTLDLSQITLDDLDLRFISEYFKSIKRINLSNQTKISVEGLDHLFKHQIESISFKKSNITDLVCCSIVQKISSSLKKIDLSSTPITEIGILSIFQSKEIVESLEYLSLSRCYSINIPMVITSIREKSINPRNMRSLDLSYLDLLFTSHIDTLFRDIVWKNLRTLNIKGCQDIPLKSIRRIKEYLNYSDDGCFKVNINHNARLEDHSIEGVKAFLLGLYSLQ